MKRMIVLSILFYVVAWCIVIVGFGMIVTAIVSGVALDTTEASKAAARVFFLGVLVVVSALPAVAVAELLKVIIDARKCQESQRIYIKRIAEGLR